MTLKDLSEEIKPVSRMRVPTTRRRRAIKARLAAARAAAWARRLPHEETTPADSPYVLLTFYVTATSTAPLLPPPPQRPRPAPLRPRSRDHHRARLRPDPQGLPGQDSPEPIAPLRGLPIHGQHLGPRHSALRADPTPPAAAGSHPPSSPAAPLRSPPPYYFSSHRPLPATASTAVATNQNSEPAPRRQPIGSSGVSLRRE